MAEVYSSLYKGKVHVTTQYSTSHTAIDLGNYKTRNAVYSAIKLGAGKVVTVDTSYRLGGITYKNSLVVWIEYDSGFKCGMYHGRVEDCVVKVGDRVAPGQQVYRTGSTGKSTGDHLHYILMDKNRKRIDPAPWVLNDENVSSFRLGQKVAFVGVQYIRHGEGLKATATRKSVIGQTATIKDGPRYADGFVWWDMAFDDTTGWVADIGEFKLYVEPPKPQIPSEVEALRKENEQLKKSLHDVVLENDSLRLDNGNLLGNIAQLQLSLDQLQGTLQKERDFRILVSKVVRMAMEE